MLTQKDYCDYETCVALKELGYDELCDGYYHLTDDEECDQLSFNWCYGRDFQNSLDRWRVGVPMLSEAQDWLKENYNQGIEVRLHGFGYQYEVWTPEGTIAIKREFRTYKEALSEGIKAAVKILKGEEI